MKTTEVVSKSGYRIKYWLEGPEDGEALVFTHGATLDHKSFKDQVPVFVEKGYRVLTWDMPGHGQSLPMGKNISLKSIANDILEIMDDAKIEKATLVGHSLGGFVSQVFTYDNPERVDALVLIGCTDLSIKPGLFYRMMYPIMPRILRKMQLESFREKTLADIALDKSVKEYAENAMEHISKEDFIKIIMLGVEGLWTDAGIPKDHIVPLPFLLLHGDSDNANGQVYKKQSPDWAKAQPNCRYKVVPNAGHTAHMDNPKAFNEILADFLSFKNRKG